MPPEDLADDLSVGLIRQWIESRGVLRAEDVAFLYGSLQKSNKALERRVDAVIQAHTDDHEWGRLQQMLNDELVRRGETP